jgi:hypothetical protein
MKNDEYDYYQMDDLIDQTNSKGWIYAAGIVGLLVVFGVILTFAGITGRVIPLESFSAKVSIFYCPVAALLIFLMGWFNFPLAAAVFYGYLGLAQATSSTYFIFGTDESAVTFEMLLAIPLIGVGLLRTPAKNDGFSVPVPRLLSLSFVLILFSAVASTAFSVSPKISIATFTSRFLLPILVTVVCFRSLKAIDDLKTIGAGYVIGMLAIAVFDFRRAVLGQGVTVGVSQRFVGATMSFALPSLLIIGAVLWFGYALAEHKSILKGSVLMALAGLFGVLIWLSGSRGTFAAFVLIGLWWFPFKFLRALIKPKLLIIFAIGFPLLAYFVLYALKKSYLDVSLITERFQIMFEGGVAGESRWYLWMEGLGYWKENILFGRGLNSWVLFNSEFVSVHGSAAGILLDTGLLGAFSFGLFFISVLYLSQKKYLWQLNDVDRQFFLGIRNSWIIMMLLLSVQLPFTSGQPRNNIFAYAVYMLPMFVMLVHSRYQLNPASYSSSDEWADEKSY